MKYSFHADAEIELIQAVDYYEGCEPGLGYDFALEVYASITRIIAHPDAWQSMEENIRRSLVNRFPYGIIYAVENNEIFILAVMHLHRRPEHWKTRV